MIVAESGDEATIEMAEMKLWTDHLALKIEWRRMIKMKVSQTREGGEVYTATASSADGAIVEVIAGTVIGDEEEATVETGVEAETEAEVIDELLPPRF